MLPSEKHAKLLVKYHDRGWMGLGLCPLAMFIDTPLAKARPSHATIAAMDLQRWSRLRGDFIRSCKIDIYWGSAVPDLDFTNPMSALLRLPSTFTSERKFEPVTNCPD